MNAPTGSPAKRGYACAMNSTRSVSVIDMARDRETVRILERDPRHVRPRRREPDSAGGVDAHGAHGAPSTAPRDRLAEGWHPWIAIDQRRNEALVRVQRA